MIDPTYDPAPAIHERAHRAGWATVAALDGGGTSLPGVAFERVWMRILDAYDTLHQAGIACPSEGHMFRLLRTEARRILLSAPSSRPACWLVPATPRDVTACHLVAVSLMRCGEHVRLWPWQSPAPGAGRTVGKDWRALIREPLPVHGGVCGLADSA